MKKKTDTQTSMIKRVKRTLKSKKYKILSAMMGDTWSAKEANPKHGNKGGFTIQWVCKDIGFGELTFYVKDKGKVFCETECMNREFIDQVMKHFLDSIEFLDK